MANEGDADLVMKIAFGDDGFITAKLCSDGWHSEFESIEEWLNYDLHFYPVSKDLPDSIWMYAQNARGRLKFKVIYQRDFNNPEGAQR